MNDRPVACQTRGPTDPQGDRWHGEAVTDEVPPRSGVSVVFVSDGDSFAPAGSVPPIPRRRQPPPTHCGAPRRNGRDLIIATRPAHQPLPSLLSAAAAQGLFRAPARAFLLSPTAPFLPTAEEMGERTPAETTFLHFLSALCLFAAARAFPHVTGVFLIVVGPPTAPAQLSAAAACYYGKNYSFCRVAG